MFMYNNISSSIASTPTTDVAGGGEMSLTQPPMLTFKHFVGSLDDYVTDVEAVKKFADYKTDFHKQQINEFFLQHKDVEWFVLVLNIYSM